MWVRLVQIYRPVRIKARQCSPKQRTLLDRYNDKLVDFLVQIPTAAWQAAPLLDTKPGSKSKYRMAVRLRPVNSAKIKESWPMPHLGFTVTDFARSTIFADVVSAYWQLPLHPNAYKACGIVTPKKVLVSKRVLPGLANARSYFQITVEPFSRELIEHMKSWLHEFNVHGATESELLNIMEKFFDICSRHNLYLPAVKSKLFAKQKKWCGRVIDASEYTMDPAHLSAVQNMELQTSASELTELVYCCRWMSSSIPDFARRVALLYSVLDEAHLRFGKRTKRSIKRIPLHTLS